MSCTQQSGEQSWTQRWILFTIGWPQVLRRAATATWPSGRTSSRCWCRWCASSTRGTRGANSVRPTTGLARGSACRWTGHRTSHSAGTLCTDYWHSREKSSFLGSACQTVLGWMGFNIADVFSMMLICIMNIGSRSSMRAYRPFRGLRFFTREELEEKGPPLTTKVCSSLVVFISSVLVI